ncbi:50S ribosomal protein L23 [Candidatus Kaiserbacteria bacterium]|nr:50S ribosomal protein L23 [Candidatus Kaiserbacteria bacterium]
MALFGSKKNIEKKAEPKAKAEKKSAPVSQASSAAVAKNLAGVLVRPRITEKAANMTASNVYTFDIAKGATKKDVAAAVRAFYKVTPVKVNVVNTPAKRVRMRRKRGFGKTTAPRKAYVYLKKGDEIQFA